VMEWNWIDDCFGADLPRLLIKLGGERIAEGLSPWRY